jgi:hypothetical protein
VLPDRSAGFDRGRVTVGAQVASRIGGDSEHPQQILEDLIGRRGVVAVW